MKLTYKVQVEYMMFNQMSPRIKSNITMTDSVNRTQLLRDSSSVL